jgi:rubrerythrin
MEELAKEERGHSQQLKKLKERGLTKNDWHQTPAPNLKLSDYFIGGETLAGAGLQDTLIFAMKREQQAIEFYSRMMGMLGDETAKRLCQKLVNDELRHKLRLELLYDDLFYRED